MRDMEFGQKQQNGLKLERSNKNKKQQERDENKK